MPQMLKKIFRPGVCVAMLAFTAGVFAAVPNEWLTGGLRFAVAGFICLLAFIEIVVIYREQARHDKEQVKRDEEITRERKQAEIERKVNQERFENSISAFAVINRHFEEVLT